VHHISSRIKKFKIHGFNFQKSLIPNLHHVSTTVYLLARRAGFERLGVVFLGWQSSRSTAFWKLVRVVWVTIEVRLGVHVQFKRTSFSCIFMGCDFFLQIVGEECKFERNRPV